MYKNIIAHSTGRPPLIFNDPRPVATLGSRLFNSLNTILGPNVLLKLSLVTDLVGETDLGINNARNLPQQLVAISDKLATYDLFKDLPSSDTRFYQTRQIQYIMTAMGINDPNMLRFLFVVRDDGTCAIRTNVFSRDQAKHLKNCAEAYLRRPRSDLAPDEQARLRELTYRFIDILCMPPSVRNNEPGKYRALLNRGASRLVAHISSRYLNAPLRRAPERPLRITDPQLFTRFFTAAVKAIDANPESVLEIDNVTGAFRLKTSFFDPLLTAYRSSDIDSRYSTPKFLAEFFRESPPGSGRRIPKTEIDIQEYFRNPSGDRDFYNGWSKWILLYAKDLQKTTLAEMNTLKVLEQILLKIYLRPAQSGAAERPAS